MIHDKNILFSKRHNTRLLAVSVMYDIDLNSSINEEDKHLVIENTISDVLMMTQTEFLSDELDELYDQSFLRQLVNKCYLELDVVDNLIINSLVKWSLDRLSYVDRAIIRIATAEMLLKETAKNVIIDEALEMTKELTSVEKDMQVKFNNRLLENIAGKIYGN